MGNKKALRNGISLISLIGIILLLLVFAGLILRMVLGPNGLLSKSEREEYRKTGIELRKVLIQELDRRNKLRLNEETDNKNPMFKSPQEITNICNKKAEDLNAIIKDVSFFEISDEEKTKIKENEKNSKIEMYINKGNELSKTDEFKEGIKESKEPIIIRVTGTKKNKENLEKYIFVFEMTFEPDNFVSINGDVNIYEKKAFEKQQKEEDKKKKQEEKDNKPENKEEKKENK